MSKTKRLIQRTRPKNEESVNALSHGVAFLGFGVATGVLLCKIEQQEVEHFTPAAAYGGSLLLTFLASCFYHFVILSKHKEWAKMVDHIAIFFLIAGTNTPLVCIYMDNRAGMVYLMSMWILVVLGIILKVLYINIYPKILTFYYMFLGWCAALILPFMWKDIPIQVSNLIIAGGIFYSSGVYFYLEDHKPWRHLVWHIFVIVGAVFHFTAVWHSYNTIFH